MLFIPQEKARETCKRLLREAKEERRERMLKRREEYLKAKENNDLDSYFAKYIDDYQFKKN